MIQTRPLVGAALFAAAMQIVPATDSIAKILTADFEPTQIAWSRTFFQALFLASALALVNFRARGERVSAIVWQPRNWGAFLRPHWIRGFCWAGATVSFFVALRENPLPNALAALFVAPLAATALAPLFLGERVRPFYALCALGGFCGVVVVLRPAAADFRPSILFAVAAGLFYAGYLLATRFSAARFVPLENALGAALTGLLLLLPLALWRWDWPSGGEWATDDFDGSDVGFRPLAHRFRLPLRPDVFSRAFQLHRNRRRFDLQLDYLPRVAGRRRLAGNRDYRFVRRHALARRMARESKATIGEIKNAARGSVCLRRSIAVIMPPFSPAKRNNPQNQKQMANTRQSAKRARQAETRRRRNQAARSRLRTEIKKARIADPQNGAAIMRALAAAVDRAAGKGVFSKRAAARIKSRVNARLKTAAPAAAPAVAPVAAPKTESAPKIEEAAPAETAAPAKSA